MKYDPSIPILGEKKETCDNYARKEIALLKAQMNHLTATFDELIAIAQNEVALREAAESGDE